MSGPSSPGGVQPSLTCSEKIFTQTADCKTKTAVSLALVAGVALAAIGALALVGLYAGGGHFATLGSGLTHAGAFTVAALGATITLVTLALCCCRTRQDSLGGSYQQVEDPMDTVKAMDDDTSSQGSHIGLRGDPSSSYAVEE